MTDLTRDLRVVGSSEQDPAGGLMHEAATEIDRLNAHCDGYEDAMLKERRLAEMATRELRTDLTAALGRVKRLRKELGHIGRDTIEGLTRQTEFDLRRWLAMIGSRARLALIADKDKADDATMGERAKVKLG